ncbi:MAG: alpha/beta hydrolase family esterase [Candidatus Dormibacterales bacterium]
MDRRTIDIGGVERVYWLAHPVPADAPLLVVLHGSGIDGLRMAGWTGLVHRGPEAGFATVFPDAQPERGGDPAPPRLPARMWDDTGAGRRDGLDDSAFIQTLIDRLVADRIACSDSVVLVGLSNGAFFAERLARHGLVPATGIALVAGTAREASRKAAPRPTQASAVLCIAGAVDRVARYGGGRATGLMGRLARRRSGQILLDSGSRETVAVEDLAADWAAANGCGLDPLVEEIRDDVGHPAGERLTWAANDRQAVVVWRLRGAGHGWPGGPQYAPAFLVGRIPRHVDATGIVLDFARKISGLS